MAGNTERPSAEEIVRYEKDRATKIATITINRPDALNAPTIAARQRFADLVLRANVDDDVKVLIIRGVGEHLGSGADLPEMAGMFSDDPDYSVLPEFGIGEDEDVTYPPEGQLPLPRDGHATLRQLQLRPAQPPGLQEDQHRRGQGLLLWLAFLPGRRCRPRHRFRRRAVRPLGLPLRRLGRAHVAVGADDGPAQVPGDGVHRPSVHRRRDEGLPLRQQGRAAGALEAETIKYALACSRNRPTDTVVMQKTFFEVFKQQQGEYMGSVLTGWLESMLPMVKNDGGIGVEVSLRKGPHQCGQGQRSAVPAGMAAEHGRAAAARSGLQFRDGGTACTRRSSASANCRAYPHADFEDARRVGGVARAI